MYSLLITTKSHFTVPLPASKIAASFLAAKQIAVRIIALRNSLFKVRHLNLLNKYTNFQLNYSQ